ncbi:hypothetical protein [Duganella vulcania]|uniref:Uncharacterized protein n=1 Tax=Duganella vulcania TaxID=2692166 RepID=A0A845GR97_9BURK|nr:hypothetical protein [Duganella vulcania]MYM95912.1 hypothetical protein [Duganella vulcania]
MLIIAFAALLQATDDSTVPRKAVVNPRELMIEAIDAPDGSAHGMLTGEMAEALKRGFGTTAPLRIDVTTLKRYRQEGCRRLNVAFSQDDVRSPGAPGGGPRRIDFGIDYCRDGRPPSSRAEAE